MIKKVCILTSGHSACDVRIFHKQAKTLSKAGYNVVVVGQHEKDETIDGVQIISQPRVKKWAERSTKVIWNFFWVALKRKADIYHFHDPELILCGILLKLFTRAKVIYDVHEDFSKQVLSKYRIPAIFRIPISVLFKWIEKLSSVKFDYIVTATPDIKKNFKTPNVIDVTNYQIVSSDTVKDEKDKNPDRNEHVIICIGGLSIVRGVREMVRSLSHININSKVRLRLLGKFSDRKIEAELRGLKEWDMVEYIPSVPYPEVAKYLSQAKSGLVCFHPEPNHVNAIPNKIFEYMWAGLPVIASDFPLWRGIIADNQCGLMVNPLDPEEIARAVEYLIEHPEEAEKMGENGRKAVVEKYNWEKEAQKLLGIYSKISDQFTKGEIN